ncbi:hypothetical protein [Streptomyces globisporus]|uniref:hypothetical protein n=1 Tax=Streptomyces globisporus TaxID=1908 RepID=UPI00380D9552
MMLHRLWLDGEQLPSARGVLAATAGQLQRREFSMLSLADAVHASVQPYIDALKVAYGVEGSEVLGSISSGHEVVAHGSLLPHSMSVTLRTRKDPVAVGQHMHSLADARSKTVVSFEKTVLESVGIQLTARNKINKEALFDPNAAAISVAYGLSGSERLGVIFPYGKFEIVPSGKLPPHGMKVELFGYKSPISVARRVRHLAEESNGAAASKQERAALALAGLGVTERGRAFTAHSHPARATLLTQNASGIRDASRVPSQSEHVDHGASPLRPASAAALGSAPARSIASVASATVLGSPSNPALTRTEPATATMRRGAAKGCPVTRRQRATAGR